MIKTHRFWSAVPAVALAIGAMTPAEAAGTLPYVGAWGSGPTDCSDPFRFTATTYKPPGEAAMRILRREREGRGYRLRFAKGYVIGVQVRGDKMNWSSLASGDTFDLKRCPASRR